MNTTEIQSISSKPQFVAPESQPQQVPYPIPVSEVDPHSTTTTMPEFPLTAPIHFTYGPWVCAYDGPTFFSPTTLESHRTVNLQPWQSVNQGAAQMLLYPYMGRENR